MKRFRLGTKFLTTVSMLLLLPMTILAANKQDNRPAVTTAAIPTNYKEICNALPSQNLQHPYLVFDEAGKNAILDNIKKDEHAATVYQMLVLEGERYLRVDNAPEPAMNDIRARFTGKDDHAAYQNYYQYGSIICALLYQFTGDTVYAQRSYELASKLCAMDTWRLSAHCFETLYERVWPYGAKDDQVVFPFDIWVGDAAADLALTYDWIYPALNKAQRDRLRNGLLEQAILRVRNNYEYAWWASAYKCNWSGICYNGLGLAALTLLNEDPQLTDVVIRSVEGIGGMLSNITPEGGWQEGRHYAVYGLSQAMIFMDAMKRLTDGKINMFEIEGVKKAPADFALFGMTGNFNDGGVRDKGIGGPIGSPAMYGKLAAETGDGVAMYYIDTFLGDYKQRAFGGVRNNAINTIWDLIWPIPTNIPAAKPADASKYFPGIEWAFMRKDFGDEYLQVATKCGKHDDPHHGHLDAGTFNLTWKGESVIGEFSQEFYDMFISDDGRWDYLNIRSLGHNVVLVNGEEQIIAKRKNQPWKEGIGGEITKFESLPTYAYTQMDATKTYPGVELKGWKRTLILDKENNIVLVLDKIKSAKDAQIDLLFHSNINMTVAPDGSYAALDGERAHMEMRAMCSAPLTISKQNQFYYRIVEKAPYSWIPCLYTTVKAPSETTVIGTVFYPTELKDQAAGANQFTLDESGKNPILRYTVGDKNYAYEISDSGVKAL